jgi:hypothetical protein
MNKTNKAYHGDVLLTKVNEIPEGATIISPRKDGKLVLREGEHSGHAHVIEVKTDEAEMLTLEGEFFLKVNEPVTITHEEHAPGKVEPGLYVVGVVRERDPFAKVSQPVHD